LGGNYGAVEDGKKTLNAEDLTSFLIGLAENPEILAQVGLKPFLGELWGGI
jgi:hypothetical protein